MNKNENRNIYVCEAWYVLKESVIGIEHTPYYSVRIIFASGSPWIPIPFTPGTAKFVENLLISEGGNSIKQEFTCEIPGEDAAMPLWAMENNTRPVIMKIIFNNGAKICGDLEYPIKLMSDWDSSASSTKLSFSRSAIERARWLNSETSGSGS
jgi:hypothetical protein